MDPLNMLFGQVARAIMNHSSDATPGPSYNPNDLLGTLAGLFGQHASQGNQNFDPGEYANHNGYNYAQDNQGFGNVLSSNQDPLGDPGNHSFGNVQSSNQDPYGDPGAGQFGNVQSSNQDPYGDPGR